MVEHESGSTATVVQRNGRWWVRGSGAILDYGDLEEAVEGARSLVRSNGGGTVKIYDARGLRDQIRVAPPFPPPAAIGTQPRPRARAPQATGARSDVGALIEAYQEAAARIDGIIDEVEREIGRAALRLEASETYRRVTATGSKVPRADVESLKSYVESLTGGKVAEWSVNLFDRFVRKALRDLYASLASGALTGVIATIAGFLSVFVLAAQDVGAGLFFLVIGGGAGLAALARIGYYGAPLAERVWVHSTGWADSVGKPSDEALAPARAVQEKLWRAASGTAWAYKPFTPRARLRAQVVVYLSWALLALGACMVVAGFIGAANKWGEEQINPQLDIPTSR